MPHSSAAILLAMIQTTVTEAVRLSIGLLPGWRQRRYVVMVCAQMATSLLDLLGVALVGIVGLALTGGLASVTDSGPFAWLAQLVPDTEGATAVVALAAAVVLVAKSAISGFLTYRIYRFLGRSQAAVGDALAARIFARGLLDLEVRSSQEYAFTLTAALSSAVIGLLGSFSVILSEVALLVILGVAMFVYQPFVTLVAIAYFGLVALGIYRLLGTPSRRLGAEIADTAVGTINHVQEGVHAYRELFVLNRRQFTVRAISGLIERGSMAQAKSNLITSIPKLVYEVALVAGAAALGFWLIATTDMSSAFATLAVFVVAGSRVVPSLLRLSSQAVSMKAAVGHAGNLYELVREGKGRPATDLAPSSDPRSSAPPLEPRIEIAHVSFRYPNATAIALREINLTIDSGSFVALVGSTGAGKSTLADVILGLIPVDSGTVQIGGHTPERVIAGWPGAMAYVPQTVTMVTGTVRENVALALPPADVDDELIWSTLDRVRLADYFSTQRDGLDTLIGERGIGLSGGQRQRLGIARALYSQPRILVLDEATSALDAETEAAIADTVSGLEGEVTRIVIAHRLATVRAADLVVLLKDGMTEAIGSFDEVRGLSSDFDFAATLMGLDK